MIHPEPIANEPVTPGDNPFKGLAYYDSGDAARFAGRQRDIEAVANGILRTRTFIVYGRSGLGKTSLLLAGVFPRLETLGCRVLDVRLLEHPLDDLRRALGRRCGLDEQASVAAELGELIRCFGRTAEGEDRLVVIAFDQFEEFFVRFADQADPAGGVRSGEELDRQVRQARIAQRGELIREIGRLAAQPDLNLRLVFSLREDWLAQMGDFAEAVPEILQHMHRLLPLTSFGVRQAIVETLRAGSVDYDSRLISALVDTLADVHFDPIVLQVFCSEVWERARERCENGPLRLELADLQTVGGVRDVFRGYLAKALDEIGPEELPRRRKVLTGAVLDALISEKRTKLAMSREALRQQHFHIEEPELEEVLDRLYRNRLVRVDPRGGVAWYELVHERLVGAILEWFETDRDFFDFRSARALVVNSCRNRGWRENPGLLLNEGQIDGTVGPFKELFRFNDEEKLFLVSSAVYGPSKHLEYWANLAGLDTSTKLLDHYLDQQQYEQLRMRAAQAAGGVKERRDHFARRCLVLALQDRSEKVRKEAACSFAELAEEPDFEALAGHLRDRSRFAAARAVLVEVIDRDKLPAGTRFSRFDLWKARRKLYQRKLDASRKEIRSRGLQGAMVGFTAALLWSFTAGLLLTRMALYELNPSLATEAWWIWPAAWGGYLLIALLLGTWTGWRDARRVAQEALRQGKEGLVFAALARGPVTRISQGILLASILLGLIGAALPEDSGSSESGGEALMGSVLIPGVTFLALLGLIHLSALIAVLARPAIGNGARRGEPWLWAWLWSFGASLIIPLILWPWGDEALRTFDPDEISLAAFFIILLVCGLLLFSIFSATIIGTTTCSSLLAMEITVSSRSAQEERLGTAPAEHAPRSRRWSKAFGLLLALLTGGLLFHHFGWDSLPLLARKIDLENPEVPRSWVRSGTRDTLYVDLVAPRSSSPASLSPRLAELTSLAEWTLYVKGLLLREGVVFVLRPGESQRLALERSAQARRPSPFQVISDLPLSAPRRRDEVSRLVTLRLGRDRTGNWSAPLIGLDRFAEGRPMSVTLGSAVESATGCAGEVFSVRLHNAGAEGGGTIGVPCIRAFDRISFTDTSSWRAAGPAPEITVRAWRPQFELPHGQESSAWLSPDGSLILTRSADADSTTAYVWPVVSKAPTFPAITLRHDAPVDWGGFSPDGRHVFTVSEEAHMVRVWPLDRPSVWIGLRHESSVDQVIFSADGTRLAVISDNLTMRLWSLEEDDAHVSGTFEYVDAFAFDPSGNRFATADSQGVIRLWTDGGRPIAELSCGGETDSAFSEDSASLDLTQVRPRWIGHLGFSADGRRLLASPADGTHCLWDTGQAPIARLQMPYSRAQLSLDGQQLLLVSQDGVAQIQDVRTGQVLFERLLKPFQAFTYGPELSPDGRLLVSVDSAGRTEVWRTDRTGEPIVLPYRLDVKDIVFDSRGTRLALEAENAFHVWNLENPGETAVLMHGTGIVRVQLSPINDRVLLVPGSGRAQVWDLSRPVDPQTIGDLFLFLRVGPLSDPAELAETEAYP